MDDGKSTLIGRLLWDSKAVHEDQAAAVAEASARRGHEAVNLAMLTDGLRAERDRGITIDVAYRYFATARRRFILADTPGHVEYTRNMVTGASNADVAVVLVDAHHGLVEQTRRHVAISGLLHVPHLVVAVNKMDLVGWREEPFTAVVTPLRTVATRLGFASSAFIPISALQGDNVVEPSDRTPWYEGLPLLRHLEEVPRRREALPGVARLPVQWVVPAAGDSGPGCAGRLTGGDLRPGDDVVVLPSGATSTVAAIETFAGRVDRAHAGMSVTVRMAGDAGVSRGDLLCRRGEEAIVADDLDAVVCWLGDEPMVRHTSYALKHTSRWTRATLCVRDRLDVATMAPHRGDGGLGPNDIGRVSLRLSRPIAFDPYRHNRITGSFILVDESTHATVAAGMALGPRGTSSPW